MPDLPAAGRLDPASSVFLDRSLRLPPAFAGMTIFRYLIAGVILSPWDYLFLNFNIIGQESSWKYALNWLTKKRS